MQCLFSLPNSERGRVLFRDGPDALWLLERLDALLIFAKCEYGRFLNNEHQRLLGDKIDLYCVAFIVSFQSSFMGPSTNDMAESVLSCTLSRPTDGSIEEALVYSQYRKNYTNMFPVEGIGTSHGLNLRSGIGFQNIEM